MWLKKIKHNLYKTVFLLLIGFQAQAQELLKLEDAVKIALENNYEIKIASNNLKIDETNSSAGNAGMLPNITANVVNTNSIQNITQTQSDGSQKSLDGAKNLGLNYGVNLGWTVFDGMKMFAKREQLKVLQKQGESDLKLTIFTKISDVYATYFNLVQQQQQLMALDSTLILSNERLTTAQNRYTIGKASKLVVLNAQVDLNTDTSLRLTQLNLYQNTKIQLNQILARDTKIDFKVANEIPIDNQLKLDDLKSLSDKQNPQLQSQILAKNSADLQLKQVKAGRYPTVTINSGYGFSHTEASLGFVTQSQGRGLTYGFTAAIPIFNGFYQSRNEKIAKIQVDTADLVVKQQQTILDSQLGMAFQSYQTNLQLTTIEKSNVDIAKQNLDITLAKFKIGTITPIDYRTAQLNYVNALVRYSNAQFQTKLNEITLSELAGNLKL
ncbi:TolC family protein [Flavobacterium sp. SUN052]|uniref:TolC family protein n=1 Tax=Flavobacterium sp. SUN052 TaxID=3002441 RepID=UPI00237DC85D|nr:TolC family protein [Flavobacterium sp. SUN052]MEC4005796.1 TolC family protein [Flavobacterium sp. SUN052]